MPNHESSPSSEQRQANRRFLLAKEVRKYEIDKFWQRSIFFWGFIAASFLAYVKTIASRSENTLASLLVACFGLVCSMAWTLSNRGSKYWQESWEMKVNRTEEAYLGEKFFDHQEQVPKDGFWGPARFSVSKLTVALSDFTVLVWTCLVYKESGLHIQCVKLEPHVPKLISLFAVLYSFRMFLKARTNFNKKQ